MQLFLRRLTTKTTTHAQAGTKTYMNCPTTHTQIPRQSFLGVVIGTKAQKTIKVRVERNVIHPIVMKNVVSHKNFLVHDPNEDCVVGDIVRCVSCLKLSKMKSFVVGEIVAPAERFVDSEGKVHTQEREVKKDMSIEAEMKRYGQIAIEDLKDLK